MEKNKISKIIALLIVFVLITCISTRVFADEQLDLEDFTGEETEEEFDDLTDELEREPDDGENEGEPDDGENEGEPDDGENEGEPDDGEEDGSSEYGESDIPYAGPADTILMIALFITLAGISGFTFIKLSEYSNI